MFRKVSLLILVFCSFYLKAAPPPVPSAGVIERQIEKEYEAQPFDIKKAPPEIELDIPEEKLTFPEGKKVMICQVNFSGNTVFTTERLRKVLQDKMNQQCSIQDIYDLCRKIENFYMEQGYFLARAYPPPQKISNGILKIEIMEGYLGNVKVSGNKYYSEKFVAGYFQRIANKPIRYDQFLRAIMLLNENEDLTAGAIFTKGETLGHADLIVQVDDKNPIHLYLNGNNYGKWLTTDFRAGARFDKGSLFTYGDHFSIAEVLGFPVKALYFTNILYKLPLNKNGAFLEGAYLTSRFRIQELKQLRIKGRSDIATLKGSYALKRSRHLNLDLFSYFDYKQIKNYSLGQVATYDKLRILTFGLLVDHNIPAGHRDYLNVRAGFGLPGFLNGLDKGSSLSSRPGAKGDFIKLNADYDRLQRLPYDSFLFFHTSAQWSPDKLTVPEQIYIGGADTVRGFPLSVALGDMGFYMNLEFRIPPFGLRDQPFFNTKKKWKDVLQFSAFIDQGGVNYNKGHSTFLTGTGIGCVINGPFSLSLTVNAAAPLNHHDLSKDVFYYIKLAGQVF